MGIKKQQKDVQEACTSFKQATIISGGDLKTPEKWEVEYRAKLSELAYGEMQLYKLSNYYHPAI